MYITAIHCQILEHDLGIILLTQILALTVGFRQILHELLWVHEHTCRVLWNSVSCRHVVYNVSKSNFEVFSSVRNDLRYPSPDFCPPHPKSFFPPQCPLISLMFQPLNQTLSEACPALTVLSCISQSVIWSLSLSLLFWERFFSWFWLVRLRFDPILN